MKIFQSELPKDSVLQIKGTTYDYQDAFQCAVNDKNDKLEPADVCNAFFSSAPKWVKRLFTLRNKIVGVLGLKTDGENNDNESVIRTLKCEPGDRIGLFKVFEKNQNEVIIGEDDKHLDFRVSLYLRQSVTIPGVKDLTISTTVVFHNRLGRLYFVPVKPFHKLIVPTMLKGIVRELEGKAERMR